MYASAGACMPYGAEEGTVSEARRGESGHSNSLRFDSTSFVAGQQVYAEDSLRRKHTKHNGEWGIVLNVLSCLSAKKLSCVLVGQRPAHTLRGACTCVGTLAHRKHP